MDFDLKRLLESPSRPRILVVGDVMLDRYIWGNVDRISYEAPIPVLRMDRSENRLGGAGSVAAILAALDVNVSLATVVGDDHEGGIVRQLLDELKISSESTLLGVGRSTTVKERLLGRTQSRHPQQMVRVDREQTTTISAELADHLMQAVRTQLDGVDLVLVSDYEKGVCNAQLIPELAKSCKEQGIPLIADPARDIDYRRYAGCTAITPNRTEAGMALGRRIVLPEDGLEAARELMNLGLAAVVVTMDRDGIAWADKAGRGEVVSVRQQQVYDVTGAGDAVLSALGFGLAVGGDWPQAIRLANLAGAVEVQRLGVVPFDRRELLAELSLDQDPANHKIVSGHQLQVQLRGCRQRGQRIVMTNGCFDLLHPGHLASLQFARGQGDCLVVGLNSDRTVAALKGADRPILDEQARAEMLAALACVDFVVIFDEPQVTKLVEEVLPDVLVKSSEYATEQVVGHEIVLQNGGRVLLAPMQGAYSTSQLIERVRKLPKGEE